MEERLANKELGSDRPDITISQQTKDRGKNYNRTSMVRKKKWLCCCSKKKHCFLFPIPTLSSKCVHTGQGDLWTTGLSDVKHVWDNAR